ncbi:MAG TPA: septum formation initiator family protein [Bacteroidales bacterium]|nr:septum formation initiator family protein [Bacteroidales bacterium]
MHSRWQIYQKNKQLEKELNYYKKKIEEDKLKLYELKSSDENLEKFARERYYFKKDKEDIFVLP